MGCSSKQQMVSNFATARMHVALILCLLLLDDFSCSIEATGRIIERELHMKSAKNGGSRRPMGSFHDQDCTALCKSRKYSGGKCYPNDWDEKPLGLCCCLN
ncbi:hypothetical protein MKX03_028201 [Papaver bracteatum]|nr:hypothetical protein MKX03_028201 [Papaver bracteatum]